MLDHFSHSELACPTTDQVGLASGFGEALENFGLHSIYQYTFLEPAGHRQTDQRRDNIVQYLFL